MCDQFAAIVLSRIGPDSTRDLLELSVAVGATGSTIQAFVFGSASLNKPLLEGGTTETSLGLSGSVQMTYARY